LAREHDEASRGLTQRENSSGERPTVGESGSNPRLNPPSAPRALEIGARLVGGRFELCRYIGRGGMGLVYEAFDAERETRVALKTLSHTDGQAIYDLKHEFRSLVHVHHQNLVRFHELFSEGGSWFFTMDLVEGVHFDAWVRPGNVLDHARLESALAGLVNGLDALHAAGKLHRDLKASNVLVTATGDVLLLDFGLATELQESGGGLTHSELAIVGTPRYMAPEQATASLVTAASDVYALGVMLFEALRGEPPFPGVGAEVLIAKLNRAAPVLAGPDLPADLCELCGRMLERDPALRPTLAHVRARLRLPDGAPQRATILSEPVQPVMELVGRDVELERLQRAYALSLDDKPVVVTVQGESGIGKTALVEAFLNELRQRRNARVFCGRCYERESVPYKALDELVDQMSRYLRKLPPADASALLPRDAFALARLFPVLERVDAFKAAPAKSGLQPTELQRRGIEALAELLGRMRDRAPLVLHLDDMQWTDQDSVLLLRQILRPARPVPVLLVIGHRENVGAGEGPLGRVLDAARENRAVTLESIELGPLAASDIERLASHLLARDAPGERAAIAREARGNPFIASELASLVRSHVERSPLALTLDSVLSLRLARIPAAASSLLGALALAGRPMPIDAMRLASGASEADLDRLQAAKLVRREQQGEHKLVACYHDRIRETLLERLDESERRALYAALAQTLGERSDTDPELASRCFEGAGDSERARPFARVAAEQAVVALAFDRAAECYRKTLALGPESPAERLALLGALGDALDNAGRGREAAEAFQEAAALAQGEASAELRRRAAEQLLATGYEREGTALLREVCRETGIELPEQVSLAAVIWVHTRLRFKSLEPKPLASAPDASAELRLRTYHTAATGLIGYQPLHAALMAGRYMSLALDSGDLAASVRSMGFIAFLLLLQDAKSARAAALVQQAERLAARAGRPELAATVEMLHGVGALHDGRYAVARERCARAASVLRERRWAEFELDSARMWDTIAAHWAGDYADIAQKLPPALDEAARRGRVWALAMLSGYAGLAAWLGPDDPEGCRRHLTDAKRRWGRHEAVSWPDFMLATGDAMLSVYEGRAAAEFSRVLELHRAFVASPLTQRGAARLVYFMHMGRFGAAALRGGAGAEAEALVRACQKALGSRPLTANLAVNRGLEASLLLARGEQERAEAALAASVETWEAIQCRMYAAGARVRLGELRGGDGGRALVADGERSLRQEDVKDTERMTELTCPGCAG
jgi:hypothetical protein